MFGRSKKRELKAAETLAAEVRAQREVTQQLVERYEQRTRKTVQAIEAASKAREQRDEYRRVLAAAIASERRQELHVTALERELKDVKEGVLAEARARGAAEAASESARARTMALEAELREAATRLERERGDAADRAWAEREAARGEMVQLVARSRDEALTLTAEVRRALSWMGLGSRNAEGASVEDSAVSSTLRQRGRLLAALALMAVLVAVSLTPAAALAAVDAERAAYIQLASGASPWQLIVGALGCYGAAVVLYTRALRDLRSPSPGLDAGASVAGAGSEETGAPSEALATAESSAAESSAAESSAAESSAADSSPEGDGASAVDAVEAPLPAGGEPSAAVEPTASSSGGIAAGGGAVVDGEIGESGAGERAERDRLT
ncbi:MAG: hypothetical protein P8M11_02380 [Planctomycetota bacterium]|nr:hypothetical protein [Planctomycetota bacterium]